MKNIVILNVFISLLFFSVNKISGQETVSEQTKIELQKAIKNGDEKKVKSLIDKGLDFDYMFGYDPLEDAIAGNHMGIVNLLFENGVRKYNAIGLTIKHNNIEMLRYFIDNKFEMDDYLVNACEHNSLPMVKLMVEAGADVNKEQKRRKGFIFGRKYYVSPIQMAVMNNNIEMCLYLINKGVDPQTAIDEAFEYNKSLIIRSIVDKGLYKEYNALMFSAFNQGDLGLVEYSIAKGADKNARDISGRTIFLAAVASGDNTLSKYCIESLKADPLALTNTNESALMLAVEKGSEELVNYVISLGVDVNLKNNNDETAAFYAMKNESSRIFYLLVKNGAEIQITTKDNSNLLIEAAHQGQTGIVKYLIEHGVPANTKNNFGVSAYGYMIEKLTSNRALLNLFLEQGVDLETKNDGETILFKAIDANNIELCELLLKHGADINTTGRLNDRPSIRSAEMIKFLVSNGASMTLNDHWGNCFLCTAIDINDISLANFLVNNGCDIDHLSARKPHLVAAIKDKNLPFVKFLVEHGAKMDITADHKDIISYAKEEGSPEIASYLEKMKVTEEKRKEEEATNLKLKLEKLNKAIEENQLDIVKELINENNNMELNISQQKKLSIHAVSIGDVDFLEFLTEKYSYNPNLPVNANNQTLLIMAAMSSKMNSVNYLIAKGANVLHKDYFNKTAFDYASDKEIKKQLKELMKQETK